MFIMNYRRAAGAALVVVFAGWLGCDVQSSEPVLESQALPISMTVVSGDAQVASPGTELPEPLVIRVVNSSGAGVAGQIVNWRVTQGGGEAYAGVTLTDGSGYSRERWILGPSMGAQRIEARAVDPTTGERLTFGVFTATAQAPVASVSVSPTTASVEVGQTTQLTAEMRDASGNVLTGRSVTWASANAAIATVDNAGTVRGIAAGSTQIAATVEGRSATAAVTVTATAPPPPPPPPIGGGLVFHSDFSSALGTSTTALLDTSKPRPWDLLGGSGRMNEVVPSTGLDFPTANVLKVVAGARVGGSGASSQSHRLPFENRRIPIPAVGGSIYYRWYTRVMVPDSYTADDQTHPIQDGVAGSDTNWLFRVQTNTNGTWNARFDVDATSANAYPNRHFGGNLILRKGQTYRFELQIHRIGTNTFNMHARVYDSNDVLLYDDDDFRNSAGTGSLANKPTLYFNVLEHLQGFQIGFNGLNAGSADQFPFTLYYQGAVCIRTDTWCGAYRSGI